MKDRQHFLFLNIGHFLDHFFLLIFATAAALSLATEWQLSYGQLIPYSTAGFIAFGLFSLPSGWVADRWSREGMVMSCFLPIHKQAGKRIGAICPMVLLPISLATGNGWQA